MSTMVLLPIGPDVISDLFRKAQDYLHGRETTPSIESQAGWALRGISESLRTASGEAEFERAIDLSSQPELFAMLLRMRLSPAFEEIQRQGAIAALNPPQVLERDAYEYLSDIEQAMGLLMELIAPSAKMIDVGRRDMRRALRGTRREPAFFTVVARHMVAILALSAAAYIDEPWHHWKLGRLWRVGRDTIVQLGQYCGLAAEDVLNHVYTARDQNLAQLPFDMAASERAKVLLGFSDASRDRAAS